MVETLSTWLPSSQKSLFDVIVAGRVSGGLLEDAIHSPTGFEFENDTLRIDFERGERLLVAQAMGIHISPSGDLLIEQGSEVRFSWHPQDAPDFPEAQCEEIYTVTRSGLAVLTIVVHPVLVGGPLDPEPTMCPFGGEGVPFVRLARIAGA
jgi:hypothetical protein